MRPEAAWVLSIQPTIRRTQLPGHIERIFLPDRAQTPTRRRTHQDTMKTGHNCLLVAFYSQNPAKRPRPARAQ
eukprot:1649701-Alexandrium_andersonii.AAC.1